MKVDRRRGSTTVPIWTVISLVVAMILGMGGVYYGWAQQMGKMDFIRMQQEVRQLENEQKAQDQIIFANTAAISDTRTSVAAIQEQTKQIAEIRSLLLDLVRRSK